MTKRRTPPTSNLQPPTSHVGTVSLVGAGPGDPGLITVAGLECIRRADVIVYDRLVSPRLLEHARSDAELIFMGKIAGEPAHDQEAINRLLIDKALDGKRVVRLKGGDPFVFGRGGEEAQALQAAGIPFEVVPGVTSAVAVPAYAGIPVTHRGVASSFAVITGHEDPAKEDTAVRWDKLATAVDTLVFLMGTKTLPHIVDQLVTNGRPPTTPVAVIRWGTTPEQRTVVGTLDDIVARVDEAGLTPPTIAVVGEVVRLREELSWFEQRPLFGKRVLITRTRRQAGALARLLAEEGAIPIELPAIEIEPRFDEAAVAAALESLRFGAYAWCVFTSANAVELWFELMRERGLDARAFGATKVAAIGPATAEALAERGIVADAVPEEYIAEGVVAALGGPPPVILSGESGLAREEAASRRNLGRGSGRSSHEAEMAREAPLRPGDRVLLPRAESARPELVEGLRACGAQVDEVTLYRAAVPAKAPAQALDDLRQGRIDIVTFTSSSTVRNLAAMLGDDFRVILSGGDAGAGDMVSSRRNPGRGDIGPRQKPLIACIGPITAATARELGLRVDVVAEEHTVPGLVRAIREDYGRQGRPKWGKNTLST